MVDYYPFGSAMAGRKYNQGSYRYGFNGMEKDDEVKGEGNSYTTHYRLLDVRIGKWLSTDPVIQPDQSPFISMDNNPIKFLDPKGDKVKKKREEGVSRKEFRTEKKRIRSLRKNSESYNTMYKQLEKDKRTFTFVVTNANGGTTGRDNDSEDEAYTIEIGIGGVDPDREALTENAIFGIIAHETVHAYRISLGLMTPFPIPPHSYLIRNFWAEDSKQYLEKRTTLQQKEERIAMHGENIVISELKKSGNDLFTSFQYNMFYLGMPEIDVQSKSRFIDGKIVIVEEYQTKQETHQVMNKTHELKDIVIKNTPLNPNYYDTKEFDIKQEVKKEYPSRNYMDIILNPLGI